jgi:hypothetical protein
LLATGGYLNLLIFIFEFPSTVRIVKLVIRIIPLKKNAGRKYTMGSKTVAFLLHKLMESQNGKN